MDGAPARMTPQILAAEQQNEVPLLYTFALESGSLNPPSPTVPATNFADQQAALEKVTNWGAVTLVGEGYVDGQCQYFLAAVDRLEKERKATLGDLNAIQSATIGIMGLALAAQKAIGVTGVAFGLAANLFDTTTSTFLYQLPISSVSSIVEAQRDTLRTNETEILAQITNQGLAAARLGTYLQYCVPLTIESNISNVLGNSKASVDGDIITTPTTPVLASSQPVQSSPIAKTPTANLIVSYLSANGFTALNTWMANETVDLSIQGQPITKLLAPGGLEGQPSAAQMETDRRQAINDLHIH